jgi:hypothetical protein
VVKIKSAIDELLSGEAVAMVPSGDNCSTIFEAFLGCQPGRAFTLVPQSDPPMP